MPWNTPARKHLYQILVIICQSYKRYKKLFIPVSCFATGINEFITVVCLLSALFSVKQTTTCATSYSYNRFYRQIKDTCINPIFITGFSAYLPWGLICKFKEKTKGQYEEKNRYSTNYLKLNRRFPTRCHEQTDSATQFHSKVFFVHIQSRKQICSRETNNPLENVTSRHQLN